MFKKAISLVLIIALILTTVSFGGCSKREMTETLLIEGLLDENTFVLEKDGVKLTADPVMDITNAKASIYEVSNAPYLDEDRNKMKVYDFRVEGITETDGVFKLSIPLSLKEGEVPGAGYLNEKTMKWEPVAFYYDENQEVFTVYTDHLSKYGVFSYTGQGTRKAKMEFLGLYGENEDRDFIKAVNEYAIGGVPAKECYEIGVDAFGEAVGISSDILGNLGQAFGYAAYGADVIETIGDHLGNIGLVLSVVSIGNNIMNGRTHEAIVASMKTSLGYMIGKAAGQLGNTVMSAGMAAVAIVDYSINKFGTEAVQGREDIYKEAYDIYYFKNESGYKSSSYWYKTFYPLMKNPTMSVEDIQKKVDETIKAHCNEFWGAANNLGVDYYVSQAREKLVWTAGSAGLTQDMRDRISSERRSMLYQDILPGVFQQIALKINMENEAVLRQQYAALSAYMNQSISFSVTDPSKSYANYKARFSPLNEKADVANWTGTFKKDATLNTSFTLYGHLQAGSPNTLDIYLPDADLDEDSPVQSVEFVVVPPSIEIILTKEAGRLDRLLLDFNGDVTAGPFTEDEYKGVYLLDVFPAPINKILKENPIAIPKDNIISVSLSDHWYAPDRSGSSDAGDWSASYECEVKNFSLNVTLTDNYEIPVIGTNEMFLRFAGTGTYSYDVVVTSTLRAKQTVKALGALMTEQTTTGTKVGVATFRSTGDVELYSSSEAIDPNKGIISRDDGIENIRTTGIIMVLTNPVNHGEANETSSQHIEYKSGEVKDETGTHPVMFNTEYIINAPYSFYFKYPVK